MQIWYALLICQYLSLRFGVGLASAGGNWNYEIGDPLGPDHWPDMCHQPSSRRQSPIDIDTSSAMPRDFPNFSLKGYENVVAYLVNNGRSIQVNLDPVSNPVLTGGGLDGSYRLVQFHFHFGSIDHIGSEHELDGRQFPMEVHFIHYNTKYQNLAEAARKPDGLAVLAWMFEVSDRFNRPYQDIFDGLHDIKYAHSAPHKLGHEDIHHFMGHVDKPFYRYSGSLTTPPCYESITWTVFREPLVISDQQMQMMRSMLSSAAHEAEHRMYNNFRPLQPLNGRRVYVDKDNKTKKRKRRKFKQKHYRRYHYEH